MTDEMKAKFERVRQNVRYSHREKAILRDLDEIEEAYEEATRYVELGGQTTDTAPTVHRAVGENMGTTQALLESTPMTEHVQQDSESELEEAIVEACKWAGVRSAPRIEALTLARSLLSDKRRLAEALAEAIELIGVYRGGDWQSLPEILKWRALLAEMRGEK